jgi:rhomboid protease GluP
MRRMNLAPVPIRNFTPPPAVAALLCGCVAAYVWSIASGADWWDAAPGDLLRLGANYAPAVAAGESWRLLTGIFLHGSVLHLLLNLLALADVGPAVERRLGSWRTLVLFLLCGAIGAIVSAARHSGAVSVGASGAVFGLFGVWLLDAGRREQESPRANRRRRLALAVYAVFALGSGFLFEGIDNAAHLGGFAGGLGLGLLAGVTRASAGRAFWPAALAAGLAVAVASQSLPPEWAQPYREGRRFDAIYREFAAADRQANENMRRLNREARAGRVSEAAALARLDTEIVPALREGNRRWRSERFADATIEKERLLWLEYSALRLDAISSLREAIVRQDRTMLRRFDQKMAAAAAIVEAVAARRGEP